jgi:hypothetical protein
VYLRRSLIEYAVGGFPTCRAVAAPTVVCERASLTEQVSALCDDGVREGLFADTAEYIVFLFIIVV